MNMVKYSEKIYCFFKISNKALHSYHRKSLFSQFQSSFAEKFSDPLTFYSQSPTQRVIMLTNFNYHFEQFHVIFTPLEYDFRILRRSLRRIGLVWHRPKNFMVKKTSILTYVLGVKGWTYRLGGTRTHVLAFRGLLLYYWATDPWQTMNSKVSL